jgi:hypothetical protein
MELILNENGTNFKRKLNTKNGWENYFIFNSNYYFNFARSTDLNAVQTNSKKGGFVAEVQNGS